MNTDAVDQWRRLPGVARRYRDGEIDGAVYASLYFIYGQTAAHGRRYASRRFKSDPRPDHETWLADLERMAGEELRARLLHYLERYHFLGVIPNVPAALGAWLRGEWPLLLCEYIPDAEDVLRLQVQGRRPVTVLSDYPRLLQPVLKKPNAWAFMIHDLEHAYKYFHDPLLHAGQRDFFTRLERALARGDFTLYRRDPVFAEKFVYLISDMNTHVMHGLQYLRAILIEYYLRAEDKPPRERLSAPASAAITDLLSSLGESAEFAAVAGLRA